MHVIQKSARSLSSPSAVAPRSRAATPETRRRLEAAVRSVCVEALEERRLLSVSVTGSVTLDESAGLQNGGVAVTGEDNNDNDVAASTLPASLSSRLFGGLGFSSSFATDNGVAQSAADFITVTGSGTVTSLGFTRADGTALPVLGGVDPGVASGISAVNGGAVSLFADSVLGSRLVVGVDANGDRVLALFLDPNATLTGARVWLVQSEALANPVATDADDPLSLIGLGVAAGKSLQFNFNNLPSGQNLFGTVGDTGNALVVIGKTPVLNADGTFTNTSNTINTSQGGGGVTIGVDNQMFDPGDGAYFTYVKSPDPRYLAGAPGGLDQNEADDADNILYAGGTLAATTASTTISQTQGNASTSMKITAFDVTGSPQAQAFVSGLGGGTPVTITGVKVNGVATSFTVDGNGVVVTGLKSGDKVEWTTSAPHDRVLIEGVAGKFDLGGFGINQAATELAPLTGIRYEDSGPTIGPIANSIVDFVSGASATKTLNGVVGTDTNGAPYTVDQFTASVTVNGVLVTGVKSADNQSVTYFANTNGNAAIGDAGDTPYYRLTLNQSGAGTYTFEVLFSPPPADLVFDFDDLPSGQNLFGIVGDTGNALAVIGKTPVLNADGTFTNASNTINTSQGGGGVTIGVNNQMFDPGDGAYFTYIKSPNANFLSGAPGGLDQNEADDADNIQYAGGTLEATTAFTVISQTQGNIAASMKITAFNIGDSPQGTAFVSGTNGLGTGTTPTITAVKVNGVAVAFTVDGNGVIVGGLKSGDKVEWTTSAPHDRVLLEGVAGKFDIGAFGITIAQPTPDQKLDFVARVTDGDGDANTAGFSIGIDGTGTFDDGAVGGVTVASAPSSLFSTRSINDENALASLLA